MKKIIVLALAAMLVFGLGTSVFAGAVYLDYGISNKDNQPKQDITSPIFFGVDAPVGSNWKVGVDYENAKYKKDNLDFNTELYKVGYALVNSDSTKVDLTLGWLKDNIEYSHGFYSYPIGLDCIFNLSEKADIKFNVDYGFSGKFGSGTGSADLASALLAKIKFDYYFSNVGLGLGYYSNAFKPKDLTTATDDGFTLGVVYKF